MSVLTLCVGEQWNAVTNKMYSRQLARISSRWSANMSLRLGGMMGGASYRRLYSLGFRYEAGCNLCPPGSKWSDSVAAKTASELARFYDWDILLLCGKRVWKAFGCTELLTWYEGPHDTLWLTLPHPSPLSGVWRQPGVTELARQRAEEIKAHESL